MEIVPYSKKPRSVDITLPSMAAMLFREAALRASMPVQSMDGLPRYMVLPSTAGNVLSADREIFLDILNTHEEENRSFLETLPGEYSAGGPVSRLLRQYDAVDTIDRDHSEASAPAPQITRPARHPSIFSLCGPRGRTAAAILAAKRVFVADCAICLGDGTDDDGGDDDGGDDDDDRPKIEEVRPDDEGEDDTNGLELPCGHAFHAACVRRWLQTHATCPLCRADVL